jgi:hypothetical protein
MRHWVKAPTIVETMTVPDAVADWAAHVAPGALPVELITQVEPEWLSYAGLVDALAAVQRQIAWLQAHQQRLLAAAATAPAPPPHPYPHPYPQIDPDKQWIREDLACALRIPSPSVAGMLADAGALVTLPATLQLLDEGLISLQHARALTDAVAGLDESTAGRVQAAVLARAPGQTVSAFRSCVTRAVARENPQPAEHRHEQAMTTRRVVFTPVNDGMTELWALLPAPGAAALKAALDLAAASTQPGDDRNTDPRNTDPRNTDQRNTDQRRADALIELGSLSIDQANATGSGRRGMRPAVQVTVALSTLLGLDEQPAELAGYGPIPAQAARRIAADPTGTWRRLLTDEHGKLIDYGRTTYRPPKDLAAYLAARDGTCRFPGCRRQACRCDLDHIHPYRAGGTTDRANLCALCCRHHKTKHRAHWTLRGNPEHGELEWTSPTGRKYTTEPADHPIDRTTQPRPPNTTTPNTKTPNTKTPNDTAPINTDKPPF